jgi:glycosyltransferase involved in cell wall biosynthesis
VGSEALTRQGSVCVAIPCFQQARFLAAALDSVLAQHVPATEIIVVDDGSDDDPAAVVANYPGVCLIKQCNQGLASARNAGLRRAVSDKIIFLDADDQLLPNAVAAGLRCFAAHPDAAFVYGGYREVRDGVPAVDRFRPAHDRCDLIRSNAVAMVAAVMFDTRKLQDAGGFAEGLGMCEDWDAYLRLTRDHPFAWHEEVVACYVKHRGNMSNDRAVMRHWISVVRDRERSRGLDGPEAAAWEEGAVAWDRIYPRITPMRALASAPRRLAARLARKLRKSDGGGSRS